MAVASFEIYMEQKVARRKLERVDDEYNPAYRLWKWLCDLHGVDSVDHVSFYVLLLHYEVDEYHSWFDTTEAPEWI